jgi:hypothetical protein
MFVKLVLLITFFWCVFSQLFQRIEISVKFCVFWHLFYFYKKKNLGHISIFFKLWSQTRKKQLKKSKNVFCKCVLDFNFAPIKGSVLYSLFSLKKSNSLYPTIHAIYRYCCFRSSFFLSSFLQLILSPLFLICCFFPSAPISIVYLYRQVCSLALFIASNLKNLFWKRWLIYRMVWYGWPPVSGLVFRPERSGLINCSVFVREFKI